MISLKLEFLICTREFRSPNKFLSVFDVMYTSVIMYLNVNNKEKFLVDLLRVKKSEKDVMKQIIILIQ